MARFDFDFLFSQYPTIIADMPEDFNSHEFILTLAQRFQRVYIEALYAYRSDSNAFQVVHGILSKQLHRYPALVNYEGEDHDSKDIFGNMNWCARWSRVVS